MKKITHKGITITFTKRVPHSLEMEKKIRGMIDRKDAVGITALITGKSRKEIRVLPKAKVEERLTAQNEDMKEILRAIIHASKRNSEPGLMFIAIRSLANYALNKYA